MTLALLEAKGRLSVGEPVAIVDIGSNSVRLVAYEAVSRALTPIFNDKFMCGLGRGVATTGRLPVEAIEKALAALRRFRVLCTGMQIGEVHVIATAAARDARNGKEFLDAARQAIGAPIELLSGRREAELTALGVISGIYKADGVAGDLGGGSLELNDVKGVRVGQGVSLRLGGLSLQDVSDRSPKKAIRIVREALADSKELDRLEGRSFYAIGGTWRALARLHMRQRNYPLNVMHNYVIGARDAADFAELVQRVQVDALVAIDAVPTGRRPLLAYGAVILDEIIRRAKPKDVVISVSGVREGLLYERLDAAQRKLDPLLVAARALNVLHARSPRHGEELCDWTDDLFLSAQLEETREDRRLRHAACLLADIGWRAHPDYRAEQSLNVIANAAFVGLDHPGRAYLALATCYRHTGPDANVSPQLRTLASARMIDRAHVLGAAMRVAYAITAAMGGVLPRAPMRCTKTKVILELAPELAPLGSDRLHNRVKQLSKLIGREPEIHVASWQPRA